LSSVCLKVLPIIMYGLLFSSLLFFNICFIFEPSVADCNILINFYFYCRVFCLTTVFTDACGDDL